MPTKRLLPQCHTESMGMTVGGQRSEGTGNTQYGEHH